jgi:hypothetical protein
MDIPSIESVLDFAARWPVVLSIIVAGAAGWILTLILERYFLPTVETAEDVRHQKGVTFVLNWLLATIFTTILWDALEPQASLVTRLEVSIVAGIITAFVYPMLARVATKRWPEIGSAWSPRE